MKNSRESDDKSEIISESLYRKRKAIEEGIQYNGKLDDVCLWPRNIITFEFDKNCDTIKGDVLNAIEHWNTEIGNTLLWVEHDSSRRKLLGKHILKIQKAQGE